MTMMPPAHELRVVGAPSFACIMRVGHTTEVVGALICELWNARRSPGPKAPRRRGIGASRRVIVRERPHRVLFGLWSCCPPMFTLHGARSEMTSVVRVKGAPSRLRTRLCASKVCLALIFKGRRAIFRRHPCAFLTGIVARTIPPHVSLSPCHRRRCGGLQKLLERHCGKLQQSRCKSHAVGNGRLCEPCCCGVPIETAGELKFNLGDDRWVNLVW